MPTARFVDPFELLTRREDLERMLTFFLRLDERATLAYPRAARLLEGTEASALQTRGSARRHYLHEALRSAANDAGLPWKTQYTDPPAWSYPLVQSGAFSFTVGIVETKYRGAARTLRSRGKYVSALCQRNAITDPQSDLLGSISRDDAIVPNGALGGLIVAQYDRHEPEKPAFLGFWVPSPDLKNAYYARSFSEIIGMLRDKLSLVRKPIKKGVERKPLRRRSQNPDKLA